MAKAKKPVISSVFLGAFRRAGYSVRGLSTATGIVYPTFIRRLEDPGSWRVYELKAIFKLIEFMPDEIEIIKKEVGLG